jgi:hypothetical protein
VMLNVTRRLALEARRTKFEAHPSSGSRPHLEIIVKVRR